MNYRKEIQPNIFKGEHLPIETAVYVPSTDKSQKIQRYPTQVKRVQEVRKFLSKKFGGYTSIRATGGYVIKKSGRLVREPSVKVVSFSKVKDFKKHKTALVKQVKKWGKSWGQESMGLEWEGDMWYLPMKTSAKKSVHRHAKHHQTRAHVPKSAWHAWFG